MPKALRSHFQKAVAMVDEPDIAYQHFAELVRVLCLNASGDKARIRAARQVYIGLWVLFVWARDVSNVEAPYRASEFVLLNIWNLLRVYIGKGSKRTNKAITTVLLYAIQLHLAIASELLDRKILPHVGARDAISMAVQTRSSADVNLKLFDVLGRIALTGLWVHWFIERDPDAKRKEAAQAQVARLATVGYQLIDNNRALFLPVQDQQAIEISIFLVFVGALNGNRDDTRAWLHEMVERLSLAIWTRGRYPCVFTAYRDLIAHPREKSDSYRKEATSASILIPLLAAFLAALNDYKALEKNSSHSRAMSCSIARFNYGFRTHRARKGSTRASMITAWRYVIYRSLATGSELLTTVNAACKASKDFDNLSAIKAGFWPIILTACRHFRLPVPPQFWIKYVRILVHTFSAPILLLLTIGQTQRSTCSLSTPAADPCRA